MQIAVLGIDLGKNSCSLAGLDDTGAVVLRRRMRPDSIVILHQGYRAVRGGDGGLLRRASSRPPACSARATRCG